MKNSIEKKYKATLLTALLLSVMLPVGIVVLVLGATLFDKINVFMLVAGIVMTAAGFYGTPMVWSMSFPGVRRMRTVFYMVDGKTQVGINEIAGATGLKPKEVPAVVRKLIAGRFIIGYSMDTALTVVYDVEKMKDAGAAVNAGALSGNAVRRRKTTVQCPGCGGDAEALDGIAKCPYCGKLIEN